MIDDDDDDNNHPSQKGANKNHVSAKKKVSLQVEVIDLVNDDNLDYDLDSSEIQHMSPPGSQVPDWEKVWEKAEASPALPKHGRSLQDRHDDDDDDGTDGNEKEAYSSEKSHPRQDLQTFFQTPTARKEGQDNSIGDDDSIPEDFWQEAIQSCHESEKHYKMLQLQIDLQVHEPPKELFPPEEQAVPKPDLVNMSSKKRKATVSQDSESSESSTDEQLNTKKSAGNRELVLSEGSRNQWVQTKLAFSAPKDRAHHQFQDTEDQWYLIDGDSIRIFKRGETFESNSARAEHLVGYLFTVTEPHYIGTRKYAMCEKKGACMYLKGTFIGETHAERLCENPLWRHRFQGNDFDKVRCLRRNMMENDNLIPLHLLGKRRCQSERTPDPVLVYDSGPTTTVLSDEYRFAYMHSAMLDPDNWTDMEEPFGKLRVLDFFAGCGGMHWGFKRAVFDPKSCLVESDTFAEATLRANFHQAEVFAEDVRFFLHCCIEKRPGYPNLDDFDHFHASSPCQGFSRSNRNYNENYVPTEKDTANNELAYVFVDLLRHFNLKTASFENVTGMLWDRNGGITYLRKIIADLLEIGYQCRVFTVNAADYGDPQKRSRLIIFAARFDCYLPDAPTPKIDLPQRTIHDALAELRDVEPTGGSGRVLTSSGRNVTQHSNEGGLDLKSENEHLSQCVDGLARTVRRQNGIKHPNHERLLTTRERAQLQSFPDEMYFCGGPTQQRNQIGNAVPVYLATYLAKKIYEAHLKVRAA